VAYSLEIIELSCARGDRSLFAGLNAAVAPRQLLHVLGSNGTGKTTLLRTLCGLSRPAAGEIRWSGDSIHSLGDDYHAALAYLGHLDGVQGELTPVENLRASVHLTMPVDSAAIDAALEKVGLANRRSFPAKILSQGQRRRLAIARLLLAPKPLWVLDEPFTALDARSCEFMSRALHEHLERDGIVVLSSHQQFNLPGNVITRLDLDALKTRGARAA
jgi:heme exporter protein A